jgi:hypothetical protein
MSALVQKIPFTIDLRVPNNQPVLLVRLGNLKFFNRLLARRLFIGCGNPPEQFALRPQSNDLPLVLLFTHGEDIDARGFHGESP